MQILLNATCRRDDEGRPVGMVGIGQDITDARARNEAEMRQREAEAAQAAQATISAHVYHEIRNVVGAVLALAERASEAVDLALEESTGESLQSLPAEVRFLTEHQRLVCAHAINTLNDMLDVARMENGTYHPSSLVIDLGGLCEQAAKLQGPRLKRGVQTIAAGVELVLDRRHQKPVWLRVRCFAVMCIGESQGTSDGIWVGYEPALCQQRRLDPV